MPLSSTEIKRGKCGHTRLPSQLGTTFEKKFPLIVWFEEGLHDKRVRQQFNEQVCAFIDWCMQLFALGLFPAKGSFKEDVWTLKRSTMAGQPL